MEVIEFYVTGSKGDRYYVRFTKKDKIINAYCTCQAASNGMVCRHRLEILMHGNNPGVSSGNEQDIKTVFSWLEGSNISVLYKNVQLAEEKLSNAKKELDIAKKVFSRKMVR